MITALTTSTAASTSSSQSLSQEASVINNEISNNTVVTIPEPTLSAAALARHTTREAVVRAGQANLAAGREAKRLMLWQTKNRKHPAMKLAEMQNEIAMAAFADAEDVEMQMTKSETTHYQND